MRTGFFLAVLLAGLFAQMVPAAAQVPVGPGEGAAPLRVSHVQEPAYVARVGDKAWYPLAGSVLLSAGDSLFIGQGGAAQLKIGPGAVLRVSQNSSVTLLEHLPDFTQISLNSGVAGLELRRAMPGRGLMMITPDGAISAQSAGYYRLEVSELGTRLLVRRGGAAVATPAAAAAGQFVASNDAVLMPRGGGSVTYYPSPSEEPWDQWSQGWPVYGPILQPLIVIEAPRYWDDRNWPRGRPMPPPPLVTPRPPQAPPHAPSLAPPHAPLPAPSPALPARPGPLHPPGQPPGSPPDRPVTPTDRPAWPPAQPPGPPPAHPGPPPAAPLSPPAKVQPTPPTAPTTLSPPSAPMPLREPPSGRREPIATPEVRGEHRRPPRVENSPPGGPPPTDGGPKGERKEEHRPSPDGR